MTSTFLIKTCVFATFSIPICLPCCIAAFQGILTNLHKMMPVIF